MTYKILNDVESEIEKIQRRLKEDFGVEAKLFPDGSGLAGHSDLITVLVRAPNGDDPKWLLRMSPSASFDRWANSMCIEERFDSGAEIRSYFYLHEKDIWKQLLRTLSEEYAEIEEELLNASVYKEE